MNYSFNLNATETAKAKAFETVHANHGSRHGASPDSPIKYLFWSCSIGSGCTVTCVCGVEENITDYEEW